MSTVLGPGSVDEQKHETQVVPIEAEAVAVNPDDEVPEGGYGWVNVAAVSTINCFVWGVAASFGVYLAYYLANDHFPGATPLDYALIGGLNFAIGMALAPLVTIVVRRLGTRPTMMIGVTVHALGFVSASFVSSIGGLYATQGVLIGIGISFMFIPSVAVLPQWFKKRRTLAQGISSGGSGIGGLAFSLGTNAMIRKYAAVSPSQFSI